MGGSKRSTIAPPPFVGCVYRSSTGKLWRITGQRRHGWVLYRHGFDAPSPSTAGGWKPLVKTTAELSGARWELVGSVGRRDVPEFLLRSDA